MFDRSDMALPMCRNCAALAGHAPPTSARPACTHNLPTFGRARRGVAQVRPDTRRCGPAWATLGLSWSQQNSTEAGLTVAEGRPNLIGGRTGRKSNQRPQRGSCAAHACIGSSAPRSKPSRDAPAGVDPQDDSLHPSRTQGDLLDYVRAATPQKCRHEPCLRARCDSMPRTGDLAPQPSICTRAMPSPTGG